MYSNLLIISPLLKGFPMQFLLQTLRGAEAATTFARTDDFGHFSEEQSTSSGAAVTKETVAKKPPVSISQLANGWVEGGEATATLDRETPSSRVNDV